MRTPSDDAVSNNEDSDEPDTTEDAKGPDICEIANISLLDDISSIHPSTELEIASTVPVLPIHEATIDDQFEFEGACPDTGASTSDVWTRTSESICGFCRFSVEI